MNKAAIHSHEMVYEEILLTTGDIFQRQSKISYYNCRESIQETKLLYIMRATNEIALDYTQNTRVDDEGREQPCQSKVRIGLIQKLRLGLSSATFTLIVLPSKICTTS